MKFQIAIITVLALLVAAPHEDNYHHAGHKAPYHHGAHKPTYAHKKAPYHHKGYRPHHKAPYHKKDDVVAKSFAHLDGATDATVPFTSCASAAASVQVTSLQVSPSPPSLKAPLTVIANGNVLKEIQVGAMLHIDAYVGTMKVYSGNYPICNDQTACPAGPGEHALISVVPLPKELPPFVSVKIHGAATNADGSELFCIDSVVKFVP